ncbi:MAG: response regulator transcription factor [Actinomycetota bacterium]|nr:response regulator transcription factor [Actinomycetota bacterium]
MTLKILIAEDHTLVSQGLEAMLSMTDDLELAAVVDNGDAAVATVMEKSVDVVLMDVNLGAGINGIVATKQIKKAAPDTKVLVLTMFTDPGTVAEAVKAGADGYLSKGSSRQSVIQAIHDVAEGRAVLDPNVTEGVFGRIGGRDQHALTDRELTVLQELADGNATRGVAEHIHVSEETVKTYLKNIYKKLDVRDRTEAVAEAFRRGLVH